MSYTVNIAEIQQGVTVTANTDIVSVTANTQAITVLVNAVEFATGVTNATVNGAGNLIITLSNSTQIDAGQVVTSSNYGNTTVAAYLPIYSGSIANATEIVTLTANAGAQSNQIAGANAAIITANTALKSYVDTQVTNLTANDVIQSSQIVGANAAIVTANTAMKSYVDAVTTAWTANAATQAGQITGANAAIVTANTALKAYTDGQITTTQSWVTGANAAIVTANTAMKNYVDAQTGAVTTAWTANAATQASQLAGANAAIVTANVALKGYVDAQFTALTNGAPAILDTLGEIATSLGNNASLSTTLLNSIAGSNAAIVTANTAMKSYVDTQITTTQSWVTGANAAIVTANTALKGYTDNQISTANTAMKSYVDTQDSAITTAWTSNAGVQANQLIGANAAIVTANTAMKGYVDGQITTTQSWVTGANAAIVTANTAMKDYVDGQITTTQGQITTANTALKSYVDVQDSAITTAWTANAATQAGQIAGGNIVVAALQANIGSFYTYANTTFGTTSYANANVASYMPVFGGNILAGNIDIPYTSGTRNRGPLAVGGTLNHYDSGVVASFQGNEATYLYTSLQNTNTGNTAYSSYAVNDGTHTYYGELGINSGTYDYAAAGYPNNAFSKPYATFLQSTGANLAIGTYSNHGISFLVNGQTNTADAMTIATTGLVNVAGNLAVGTTATVGNIASTNGYFWANGTAYSTGSGGTTFTGDLVGNTLTASTTGRILANAYPQGNVTQISSYTQGVLVTATPSYTGANLNSANQTVSLVSSGNVNFLTSWAAGTRTTIGTFGYMGVTATSANTAMNASDRIRPMVGGLDLNLNGKNWGALSSASNTLTPILVNGQTMNVYGTGQMGQVAGIGAAITITPVGGSISAQYATANFPAITYASTGAGYTASNIQYARLYTGAIAGAANLTIANAVALHTYTNWATGNVTLVSNVYTVLNEDTRSVISTVGNIVSTGTANKYGTMSTFNERVTALGSASGTITANLALSSIHTVTATGDITINTTDITNAVSGSSFTIVITQDGTGSRLLTSNLKYVGGTKTLSTAAGSIDVISGFYDGTNYLVSLAKGFA